MVFPQTILSLATQRLRLAAMVRQAGGQRAFSRLTGVPRSTLGDFLSGRVQTPAAQTLQRLSQPVRDEGIRVVRFHSIEFTAESIRNIVPPPGASAFRIISERIASPGREFGSTEWMDRDDVDFGLALDVFGLDPAAVTTVVFNKVG